MIDKKIQERYIDGFCAMLKSDNLRCTSIRQNILRIFFLNKHMSIDSISETLYDRYEITISKPSIYSTIKLLLSYKIITKRTNDAGNRYELTRHNEYFHLSCKACRKTLEFTDNQLKESVDLLAYKNGLSVSQMNITIYGICNNCIDNQ